MRFRFGFSEVTVHLPSFILLTLVILGVLCLIAWLLDIQILWGGLLILLLIVVGVLYLIGKIIRR
jgi:hypothetical protein